MIVYSGTVRCDYPGCGQESLEQSVEAEGVAPTRAEIRGEARPAGWTVAHSPVKGRRFDLCPDHATEAPGVTFSA